MSVIELLVLMIWVVAAQELEPPSLDIDYGTVQGSWSNSLRGRPYACFEGIPYAEPPVGSLRFQKPVPALPWRGVLDASNPPPECLQYQGIDKKIQGSEDCLYLNIFTPMLAPEEPLPVIVYIHGGAFLYGTGNKYFYDPSRLMDLDVVYVSINYRLGSLGFLSTGDDVVPGNNGLKDQSLALHWIKNNIHSFGGDNTSITILGASAGGASVYYHYLSPMSRGTFTRGITSSGSPLQPWAFTKHPAKYARSLAALANCTTSTSQEMVDCLISRPADVVMAAQIQMYDWTVHVFTPFVPTEEPASSENAFLTQEPQKIMQSGHIYNASLLVLSCSEEGLYPAIMFLKYPGVLKDLDSRWDQLASDIFKFNDTLPFSRHAAMAAKIRHHYFGEEPVSRETFPQIVRALGDRIFSAGLGKTVEEHAAITGQPTYLLRFSYRGQVSMTTLILGSNENYGVSHGDDTGYILSPDFGNTDDNRVADILVNIVYTYATTGVPKVPGTLWLPQSPNSKQLNYLVLSSPDQIEMKKTSNFGDESFWDSLGLGIGKHDRKEFGYNEGRHCTEI
ncbi:unnamed protein product [Chilo suppressalis]|uniref:Carboxylic ester hydrolase n=1 Tax=Chilo suppressalis TaxID=168631 RepID=A0ABN8EB84_CHISP|nr:unnamed protein product [Chilo suppressalis]